MIATHSSMGLPKVYKKMSDYPWKTVDYQTVWVWFVFGKLFLFIGHNQSPSPHFYNCKHSSPN